MTTLLRFRGLWLVAAFLPLYGCESGPMAVASLVDVTIESCSPPGDRIDEQVSSWLTRARNEGRLDELEAQVERWKREPTGMIATAVVHQRAWIRVHRFFGRPGKVTVDKWDVVDETREYFWPYERAERCDDFIGRRQYFMAGYSYGDFGMPPDGLDVFLGATSLSRVDGVLQRYLPENRRQRS